MDLTDTWVCWYSHSHSKRAKKLREGTTEDCGLCEREVPIDDDFDIYSSALEVVRKAIELAEAPGGLEPWFDPFSSAGAKIVCPSCLAARLPALARWMAEYRRLRAERAALIASAH